MKQLVKKFKKIERKLSEDHGDFRLFALFLRDDSPGKWDFLVSSSWIDLDKQKALKILSSEITSSLKQEELLSLSRIVVVEKESPALQAIQKVVNVEHGSAEIKDSNFFGLDIKHAYLITSKQEALSTK